MKYVFIAYKRIDYNHRIKNQCDALSKQHIGFGIISIGDIEKFETDGLSFAHCLQIEPIARQIFNLLKRKFRKPLKQNKVTKNINQKNVPRSVGGNIPSNKRMTDAIKKLASLIIRKLPKRLSKAITIILFSKRCLELNHFNLNDCFHAHDLYALPTAWLLSKMYRGKLVYDAVELSIGRNRIKKPGFISKAIILTTESLSKKADTVITAWPYLTHYLQRKYGIKNVQTILNCPPINQKVDPILRHIINVKSSDKIIVYIGYLDPGRGLEYIIGSLRYLNNYFKLVIIGPSIGSTKDDYIKIADYENVSDRVYILDPISIKDVVPYASSANIGLLPLEGNCLTQRFCLPNKLFQYMMAGCPILCTDLPGIGNFVKKHDIGKTLDNFDPNHIANVIRQIILNESVYVSNLKSLRVKYNWENEEKRFMHAIQNTIPV